MSRHETLRGIYGARAGGSASKRPLGASAKVLEAMKRPERPPATSSGARPSSCRGRTRSRSSPGVAEPTKQSAAICEATGEAVEEDGQRVEAAGSSNNSDVGESREAETLGGHLDASPDGQQDKADHAPQRRHVKNSSVLSFYGDGFLEVRLKPECQQLIAPPSDGLEGGGFAIQLLVFKAADVAKPMKIM